MSLIWEGWCAGDEYIRPFSTRLATALGMPMFAVDYRKVPFACVSTAFALHFIAKTLPFAMCLHRSSTPSTTTRPPVRSPPGPQHRHASLGWFG